MSDSDPKVEVPAHVGPIEISCQMCKHWRFDANVAQAYGHLGWGMCALPEEEGSPMHPVAVSAPAVMMVHPKFGCVQFEPPEELKRRIKNPRNN